MKKKFGALAAAGAVALLVAGCGEAPEETAGGTDTSAAPTEDTIKACMVSDAGGFDDQSFNQVSRAGLTQAEDELGVDSATTESSSDADFAPNIAGLVQENCNLVVAVGFLLADATGSAADSNPDTQFALVDSTVDPARDNVKPLLFDTAQAAYLAGYVAAGTSQTGVVGTFGGIQIPSVTIFMDGFADGVAKFNEETGGDVQVIGWDKATQNGLFTGNFDDVGLGQTTTQTLIDQDADVILPVAGPVGGGTLAAARAANDGGASVKVIWVDADGYNTQPDYRDLLLTSVVKQMDAAVFAAVESEVDGSFSSEPYVGTLENGGVSIAPFHDLDAEVPQEVKDGVAALQEQIIAGDLVIESEATP